MAYLEGRNDELVVVEPMLERVSGWPSYLFDHCFEDTRDKLHRYESTGRPLGSDAFLDRLESLSGCKSRGKIRSVSELNFVSRMALS